MTWKEKEFPTVLGTEVVRGAGADREAGDGEGSGDRAVLRRQGPTPGMQ